MDFLICQAHKIENLPLLNLKQLMDEHFNLIDNQNMPFQIPPDGNKLTT